MPNQNNTPWNATKEARLRELHRNGDSFSIIAADLGLTRSMIAGKCKRLGLKFVQQQERRCMTPPSARPKLRTVVRRAPPIEPMRLPFGQLRRGRCKYPDGDSGAFTFCGHEAAGAYCRYHSQIAYRRAA